MYEGDPQIQARIRQRMREIMTRDMMKHVPNADVVITNPTHYAVALEYQPNRMDAPMVTAKGEDEIAFRIRRVAKQNGVPMVENRPLARALYEVNIGDLIPEEYYKVTAIVFQQVKHINDERRRAQSLMA
jgi:flagellar biosynthetic protein FlhB